MAGRATAMLASPLHASLTSNAEICLYYGFAHRTYRHIRPQSGGGGPDDSSWPEGRTSQERGSGRHRTCPIRAVCESGLYRTAQWDVIWPTNAAVLNAKCQLAATLYSSLNHHLRTALCTKLLYLQRSRRFCQT